MLKPAFRDGQRLQYTGSRHVTTTVNGKEVPCIINGMLVTITKTKQPERGYGFIKNDEDGEPLIDLDSDGYNVYTNDFGQERIIWPSDKKDWKVL